MLVRLARQTYVRHYGEFSYIFGKVSSYDQMFTNANIFLKYLSRISQPKDVIIDKIFSEYSDVQRSVIESDFEEFISPLLEQGLLLGGETDDELDKKEPVFSYDCENPKTSKLSFGVNRRNENDVPAYILEEYFSKNPTLFDIQIDITQACTERCRHCYIPEYNPLFLSYDKICDVLDEFREMGGLHVSLSGGECMMHKDFIRIIEAARERDCTVSCLSNLTICTEDIVDVLASSDSTVQVSLYSMTPSIHDEVTRRKGSWVETVNAIMRLRAAQVPVLISCPCLRINYKGYPSVMRFADSLKMSSQMDFVIMGKQDCDTSNLCNRLTLDETRELLDDVILKEIPINSEYFDPCKKELMLSPTEWKKQKACGACVTSLCLNANGNYYPCPGFAGVVLGNCYKQNLKDVWLQSEMTQKIRSATKGDFKGCAECKDRDYCSTCMCRNYNETGDMFKPAEHFCKVAAINHEIVDEFQKRRTEREER